LYVSCPPTIFCFTRICKRFLPLLRTLETWTPTQPDLYEVKSLSLRIDKNTTTSADQLLIAKMNVFKIVSLTCLVVLSNCLLFPSPELDSEHKELPVQSPDQAGDPTTDPPPPISLPPARRTQRLQRPLLKSILQRLQIALSHDFGPRSSSKTCHPN
jgi:hypothetical protein